MDYPKVISHYQARSLLERRTRPGELIECSLDLGLTTTSACIEKNGAEFTDGTTLTWEAIIEVCQHENNCFRIHEAQVEKIIIFSEYTNRTYSLMPTRRAPTMLISGIPMHRIKATDPYQDTLEKIKVLKPVSGHVLDTATGLGYTAIEAARSATQVITIELDPAALEIAWNNPWSRQLFENRKIEQRTGDSFEEIEKFENGFFSCVIHDPPAFSLAGDLYSLEFYLELHRVLRPRGRLFHYIGDPESRSGRNITASAIRRLKSAGFSRIVRKPAAFGVLAIK